ncbi:hypothetical protein ACQ4PT_008124 [Festuca glaucescens]
MNQLIPRSDNHISGASASTSLRVLFMGNVSSPSKRARMDGLVPDAEEAQHHRVPLRHESYVPSGSVPQNFVRISAPTFVGNASSTSRGGRMDGFVADAEEVQHHHVPLRQASSIPSDNNGKQVLGDTSAGFNHGQEYEGDFIHGDISDTELSQKELFDNIKDLVEKSVERIVKRRTNLRKKKKKEKTVANEGHVSEDEITAYSRCSVPYLITVFKSITCSHHRKELVKKIGLKHMLDLDDCNVPRLFAQFITDNTKPGVEAIIIGEKSIPIDPKSFELVLGIPTGQLPVETDEEAGKFGFLSLFGLSEANGDKLTSQTRINDAKPLEKPQSQLPLKNHHEATCSYVYSQNKDDTPTYKSKAESDFEFSSIQCAQRQKTYSGKKEILGNTTEEKQDNVHIVMSPEVQFLGERMNKELTVSPEVQCLGERMASSPEVEFLGERVFNNICSNMSKLSDDLYNAGLTLGSTSVSTGKENIQPKRVINRSNYLCSPYEVKSTSKFVPHHEMKIYETITTLCDDPMYRE